MPSKPQSEDKIVFWRTLIQTLICSDITLENAKISTETE